MISILVPPRPAPAIIGVLLSLALIAPSPKSREAEPKSREAEPQYSNWFSDEVGVAKHLELREQCVWKEVDLSAHGFCYQTLSAQQWVQETEQSFYAPMKSRYPGMTLHRCHIPLGDGAYKVFDRVGPFNSTGGDDWHRWQWSNYGDLPSLGVESMTSASVMPVTREGDLIPIPPINAHHWHLNTPDGIYQCDLDASVEGFNDHALSNRLMFQLHADAVFPRGKGGFGGYLITYPVGFGAPLMSGRAAMFGITNDVRALDSPPMQHWLEVHTTVNRRKMRPVFFTVCCGFQYYMYDFRFDKTVTEHVPTAVQSIIWTESWVPRCFQWRSIWFHTHHEMTRDMWLLRGTGKQLGMDVKYPLPGFGEALDLTTVNATHDDVREHLQGAMYPGQLICTLGPVEPRMESVPADSFVKGTVGRLYDRKVMRCPDTVFPANTSYTSIAFYEQVVPLASDEMFFKQHHNVIGYASACDSDPDFDPGVAPQGGFDVSVDVATIYRLYAARDS